MPSGGVPEKDLASTCVLRPQSAPCPYLEAREEADGQEGSEGRQNRQETTEGDIQAKGTHTDMYLNI